MPTNSFHLKRLYPVLGVTLIMATGWVGYNLAWRIDHPVIHHLLASVCGSMLFVSVTFGALFIYPLLFFQGAPLGQRVLACLANPFLWATKECLRLTASFSIAECLYYYLNPLNLWLFFGVTAQMALMEMMCRHRLQRRAATLKIFHPVPLAVFGVSLFLVIFLYAWGKGENVYVLYLKGYRQLFGAGVGPASPL